MSPATSATSTDQPTDRPTEQGASAPLRGRLHDMWATVAPAWAEHAGYADARGAKIAERMLDLATPAPGERVLELACGPGGLGIAAAARVAPGGEVILSDVVAEMTAIAAARADALGVTNVGTCQLDFECIEQPDGAYDVVLCREGLMFATEPARAVAEIRRVLRPGGRVVAAVWGPRERNPWLGLVFDVVSAHLGRPVPPPGIPGPFSLSAADELEALLRDSGLTDVAVSRLPVPLRAASFEEWWARTSALAGPLANILAALPDADVQAIDARLRELTGAYQTSAGLEMPGLSLIASARRAG
jgi:enediyne biosynthesis protein CalE5